MAHCTVLYPKRGVSDLSRMDPVAVQERYGLTPVQYPDFAALRGRSADNLPEYPGSGGEDRRQVDRPVRVLERDLVAHADEVPGKAGTALRDHLGQVVANRQLTQLVADVPVTWTSLTWNALRSPRAGAPDLRRPASSGCCGNGCSRPSGSRRRTRPGRRRPASLRLDDPSAWLAARQGPGHVRGRTCWAPGESRDRPRDRGGRGRCRRHAPAVFDGLSPRRWPTGWRDPAAAKVLHDAKGPLAALRGPRRGRAGVVGDTALAAYLCRPDQRCFDLGRPLLRGTCGRRR